MASSIVMMEQDVSAEDIDPRNIQCPNCKSTTFVLYGNSQVRRTEAWENGVVTFTETDPKSHAFEVEAIECLADDAHAEIVENLALIAIFGPRLRRQVTVFFGIEAIETPVGIIERECSIGFWFGILFVGHVRQDCLVALHFND